MLQQADSALASGSGKQQVGDAYLAQSPLKDLEPLRRNLGRALRETIALCNMENESERPVFIVAHSLGALVAASYLMQVHDEEALLKRIRGIIFLAPAFAVSHPPGWRGWMANPLIKLSYHTFTQISHQKFFQVIKHCPIAGLTRNQEK